MIPNQYYDSSFWSSMNYPSSLLCGYIVKSSDTRTFDEIHTSAWQNALNSGSWNYSGDRYNVPNVYGNNCLDLTGGLMTFEHQYAQFDDGSGYSIDFYYTVASDEWTPKSGIIQKYAMNGTIVDHPFTNSSYPSVYKSFEYGVFGYERPSQPISEYANGEELKILLGFQLEGWDSNWNYINPHTKDGMIWGIGEFPLSYRKLEASDSYEIPPTPTPAIDRINYVLTADNPALENRDLTLSLDMSLNPWQTAFEGFEVTYEVTQGAEYFTTTSGTFTFYSYSLATSSLQVKETEAIEGSRDIKIELTGDSMDTDKWQNVSVTTKLYDSAPVYTITSDAPSNIIIEGNDITFTVSTQNVPSGTQVTADITEYNQYNQVVNTVSGIIFTIGEDGTATHTQSYDINYGVDYNKSYFINLKSSDYDHPTFNQVGLQFFVNKEPTPTPTPFDVYNIDFTDSDLVFYASVSNIQNAYYNNGKTTVGSFAQNTNGHFQKNGNYLGDNLNSLFSDDFIIQVDLIHPDTLDVKTWSTSYDADVSIASSSVIGFSQSFNTPGFIFFTTKSDSSQFEGYVLYDIKVEEKNPTIGSYPNASFDLNLYFHSSSSVQYEGGKLGTVSYDKNNCGKESTPSGIGKWWSITSSSWDRPVPPTPTPTQTPTQTPTPLYIPPVPNSYESILVENSNTSINIDGTFEPTRVIVQEDLNQQGVWHTFYEWEHTVLDDIYFIVAFPDPETSSIKPSAKTWEEYDALYYLFYNGEPNYATLSIVNNSTLALHHFSNTIEYVYPNQCANNGVPIVDSKICGFDDSTLQMYFGEKPPPVCVDEDFTDWASFTNPTITINTNHTDDGIVLSNFTINSSNAPTGCGSDTAYMYAILTKRGHNLNKDLVMNNLLYNSHYYSSSEIYGVTGFGGRYGDGDSRITSYYKSGYLPWISANVTDETFNSTLDWTQNMDLTDTSIYNFAKDIELDLHLLAYDANMESNYVPWVLFYQKIELNKVINDNTSGGGNNSDRTEWFSTTGLDIEFPESGNPRVILRDVVVQNHPSWLSGYNNVYFYIVKKSYLDNGGTIKNIAENYDYANVYADGYEIRQYTNNELVSGQGLSVYDHYYNLVNNSDYGFEITWSQHVQYITLESLNNWKGNDELVICLGAVNNGTPSNGYMAYLDDGLILGTLNIPS